MDINEAFENAYRAIFGECNVRLDELGPYLTRYHYPIVQGKSATSGKKVILSTDNYPPERVISQDEAGAKAGLPPLGINEVKDLDSIIEALSGRFFYTGNKTFGNSIDVQESDNCGDCVGVYRSHNVYNSRYVAYSSYIRDNSESIFGSSYFFNCKNMISVVEAGGLSRAFESYLCGFGSDLFFCYNCFNTSNAMFSFNLKSKRNVIGNVELPKDKYSELRKKLLDESRQYLEKNKTFYSIFDFCGPMKTEPHMKIGARTATNIAPVERAFSAAATNIFGEELGPMAKYEKLLTRRITQVGKVKTPSGNEAYYLDMFFYRKVPKERMITSEEALTLGGHGITLEDGDGLEDIIGKLGEIASYRVDCYEGTLSNIAETRFALNSANTYRVADAVNAKNCAYDTMAFDSEAVFGCFRAIHSRFSLNCHDCVRVSGCFEMDGCTGCSNSMFCHNSENLDSCMFCFNAKGLRYAIGNVEAGREKYMEIRKVVVAEMLKRLREKGEIGFDIYDLTQRRKSGGA